MPLDLNLDVLLANPGLIVLIGVAFILLITTVYACIRSRVKGSKTAVRRTCCDYFWAHLCLMRVHLVIVFLVIICSFLVLPLFTLVTGCLFIVRSLGCRRPRHKLQFCDEVVETTEKDLMRDLEKKGDLAVTDDWIELSGMGPNFDEDWKIHSFVAKSKTDNSEKPELCIIHGVGSGALVWGNIFWYMSRGFNVRAVDMPTFGRSPTPESLRKADAATATRAYLLFMNKYFETVYGDKKIFLVGHSYGGHHCLNYAYNHPERVEKLVLADPAGIFPTLGSNGAYLAVYFKTSFVQGTMRALGNFGVWLAHTWFDHNGATSFAYYWYQVMGWPSSLGDVILGRHITFDWWTGWAGWTVPSLHKFLTLKMPVSLIYGRDDPVFPYHHGEALATITDAPVKVFILSEAGHNPAELQPRSFARALNMAWEDRIMMGPRSQALAKSLEESQILYTYPATTSPSDQVKNYLHLYATLKTLIGEGAIQGDIIEVDCASEDAEEEREEKESEDPNVRASLLAEGLHDDDDDDDDDTRPISGSKPRKSPGRRSLQRNDSDFLPLFMG